MASESADLHRIVVVGGGAGGLELVTRLGDTLGRSNRADIALIDKSRAHLWKPLLHEVAAGSMDWACMKSIFLPKPIGIIFNTALVRWSGSIVAGARFISPPTWTMMEGS